MILFHLHEFAVIGLALLSNHISALPAAPVRAFQKWVVYVELPIISESGAAAKAAARRWAEQVVTTAGTVRPSSVYYSQEIEDPTKLDIITEFDRLATAEAFAASVRSGPIYSVLRPRLTGTVTAYVVDLEPADPLKDLAQAPLTEVATFWLPEDIDPSVFIEFSAAFDNLRKLVAGAQGGLYITTGFVRGAVPNPSGQNTLAVLGLVGWESLAAHNAFTQSTSFGSAIAALTPFLSGNADHNLNLVRV